MAESSNYYDTHAREYFDSTVNLNQDLEEFISKLPPGCKVLDAGCGSGRDTLALIKAGFKVEAFDASPELAELATRYTGIPVKVLRFQEFHSGFYSGPKYDGILASASLLHVPQNEIEDCVKRLFQALNPGGIFLATFKEGNGTATDSRGRFFNYFSKEGLHTLFGGIKHLDNLVIKEVSGGSSGGEKTTWLYVYATKH